MSITTSAQRALAERGGLVVSIGFYIAVISVLGVLWRIAAAANGGAVVGYSGVALSWYVATSEAAVVPLNIRLIEDIGTDIAHGSIAVELLRPASVLAVRVATETGRALPRLAACVVTGMTVTALVAGGPPSWPALLLAAPSLVLAITCNLLAQHAFAAAAFWVRDARSAWFLYSKLVFLVGGMLMPLEVLPDAVAAVAKWSPFMAMAYAPARLASGHFEPSLLLVQCGFLAALALVASTAFQAGERRLQTVGG